MRVRDHKKKKKSARWHVYTSHFMPACVFAHVRRRLIAAISDYLGSLVGSLVATATPALLTLNKRPERLGERASERASESLGFAGPLQEWLGVRLQRTSLTILQFLQLCFDLFCLFAICFFLYSL